VEYEQESSQSDSCSDTVVQPAMESGFSRSDVFTFNRYLYLYIKAKDFMKIKQDARSRL